MDRPTCATCPYWHDYVMGNGFGQCRRIPPVFRVSSDTEDPNGLFPESLALHFCGEHPDFPAFLESRKVPPPSEPSDLEIDGDVTVTRQQFDAVARVIYSHSFHASPRPTPPTAPPSSPPTPRE